MIGDGGVGRIAVLRCAAVGTLEVGIDISRVDWPGELFIAAGPGPRIVIADELLRQLVDEPDKIHPDIDLEHAGAWCPELSKPFTDRKCGLRAMQSRDPDRAYMCFHGLKLTIRTIERKLIYMVGEYNFELDGWWASWPD